MSTYIKAVRKLHESKIARTLEEAYNHCVKDDYNLFLFNGRIFLCLAEYSSGCPIEERYVDTTLTITDFIV